MLNLMIAIGVVKEDPRFKEIRVDSCYHAFEVRTDRIWKDAQTGRKKKGEDWVSVVAWNKRWLNDAVRRGDVVLVIGRMQKRKTGIVDPDTGRSLYDDELIAQEVQN